MLDRRVAVAVLDVVQHEMALAEGAALGVLARQADRRALHEQRRKGECFGVRPFDAILRRERVAAALQLLEQLGMHDEAVGNGQQLGIQPLQYITRDRGGGLGRALTCDTLRFVGPLARFDGLLDGGEVLVGGLGIGGGRGRVHDAFACELCRVLFSHGRRLLAWNFSRYIIASRTAARHASGSSALTWMIGTSKPLARSLE